jgi:hypothetical protein
MKVLRAAGTAGGWLQVVPARPFLDHPSAVLKRTMSLVLNSFFSAKP